MYPHLTIFVHSQKCAFDPLRSERAIKVLTRSFEQAIVEKDYASMKKGEDVRDSYEIHDFVLFRTVQAEKENEVRLHEPHAAE